MQRGLIFTTVFVFLLMNFVACSSIKSPVNSDFKIVVTGPEGMEYRGFCTYEVEYIGNKRTEETDINGKIDQDNGSGIFKMKAIEISCRIDNLTPEKPMEIILLKDGDEIKHIKSEGEQHDFYIDYCPPTK
jgi:hypothetical protein